MSSPPGASDSFRTNYTVAVITSKKPDAGTNANVYIQIHGKKGRCRDLALEDSMNHVEKFESGNTDVFKFDDEMSVGEIEEIRIRHDNSGKHKSGNADWHLHKVLISDGVTGKAYSFEYDNWISVKRCGDPPEMTLKVSCKKDKVAKEFKQMMEEQMKHKKEADKDKDKAH